MSTSTSVSTVGQDEIDLISAREPKVSVVIPTYNQEEFVAETIDSVLAQDYSNLEIIVTDDGSKDATPKIIAQYAAKHPGRVIPVLNPVNRGISANFNAGLARCSGEYVAWLGGDDLMLPGKIRSQVDRMERDPQVVGCFHDADVFISSTRQSLGRFSLLYNGTTKPKSGGVDLWFTSLNLLLPSTMMYRRSAAPAAGFDERLKYVSEWIYNVETFRNGRVIVTDELLGAYRRHSNNVTSTTQHNHLAFEESMAALAIVESRYPELWSLARRRRQQLLGGEALRARKRGDKRTFRRLAFASICAGGVLGILQWIPSLAMRALNRRISGAQRPA